MKRAEIEEWVTALRSGEFQQARGYLNVNSRQCCLGVKCILDIRAGRHGMTEATHIEDSCTKVKSYGILIDSDNLAASLTAHFPRSEVLEAWGMSKDQAITLTGMNDRGTSFTKIADWIEQNIHPED
jgi:hypothetical protein